MRCMSGPLPPLLAPFPSNPMQQPPKRPPSVTQPQSPTSCVSYLCNSSHSLTFCAWVCHEYMRGIYLGVYYIRDYLRPRVCACVYTCIYGQQIKDCMCPTMQTQTDSQTLHLSRVAKWIDKYIHTKRTQSQGSSKHTQTHTNTHTGTAECTLTLRQNATPTFVEAKRANKMRKTGTKLNRRAKDGY